MKLKTNVLTHKILIQPETILFSIGTLIAAILYLNMPFQTSSDSLDYYEWGLGFLGMKGGHFPYHRSAGYPIIAILTGVYYFDSSLLLEIVQLAMAVISPLLLYRAIAPESRLAAFVIAGLMLLLPFQFLNARYFMTESSFLFFLVLGFWGACSYFRNGRGLWIVLFALLVAGSIKPLADPLLFVVLPCLYLFSPVSRKTRLRQFFMVAIVFVFVFIGSIVFRYYFIQGLSGDFPKKQKFSLTAGSSMVGKMLFWQAYAGVIHYNINNTTLTPTTLISENNGAASKELFRTIRDFAWKYKASWATLGPSDYFSRFADDPDQLVKHIFARPNLYYHWFLWSALDTNIGPRHANELMKQAAYEAFLRYPFSTLMLLDNFVSFFYGLDKSYNSGTLSATAPTYCCWVFTTAPISQKLAAALQSQFSIKSNQWSTNLSPAVNFLNWEWVILRTIVSFLAVALISVSWFSSYRPIVILAWAFVIPQALLTAIFTAPHHRYINLALPFINVLAIIGIVAAIQISNHLKQLRKNSLRGN